MNIKSNEAPDRFAIAAAQKTKEKEYWLSRLSGELEKTVFPHDRKKTGNMTGQQALAPGCVKFSLAGEPFHRLMTLSNGSDNRLLVIMAAVLVTLLLKYTRNDDVLIGTTVPKQKQGIDETKLINTVLPLRIQTDDYMTFKDLLLEIRRIVTEANENRNYPYDILLEHLQVKKKEDESPLFDIGILVENIQDKRYFRHIRPNMIVSFLRNETRGDGELEYNSLLYKTPTMKRLLAHFTTLLEEAIFNIDSKLSELNILTCEEKRRILYEFNNTKKETRRDTCCHQLFEEQVEKTPDSIALLFKDEALTYRALDKRAGKLSSVLMEKGVKPGIIAVLMTERSIEMIVGILAILKAGGTYLPIDTEYPAKRIQYMIDDSFARFLITRRHLPNVNRLEFGGTVIEIDVENIYRGTGDTPCPKVAKSPGNPAYVIYTSGSTGKPKGVLVEHSSVVNLVFCQKERFGINIHDRILQFSSICFDASVEQIFVALFSGAALVLTDTDTLLDNNKFEALVSSRSITHIHAVPGFLGNLRLKDTSRLKRVISGGDVCPVALAKKWSNHCDFYNKYGPTETTVTSIEKKIEDPDNALPRLSIGRPIYNTTVYLFDKWMRPVPLGATGELYIGGEGVARGYLNHPELTSEAFIPNPLAAGERLYRTGDLALWRSDGDIEFLGRTDSQVKVRGYRIELGEIESLLNANDGVKETAVICWTDNAGDKSLCAYITAAAAGADSEPPAPAPDELREYLARTLPDYMVPTHFVFLDKIPLNLNGKIDRKALPEPEPKAEDGYIAPRDEIEEKLVEIWAEILGIEKDIIGIESNFFELGGHSLKATVMTAKIHKKLNRVVALAEIFKTPTIEGIASLIRAIRWAEGASVKTHQKMEEILL